MAVELCCMVCVTVTVYIEQIRQEWRHRQATQSDYGVDV